MTNPPRYRNSLAVAGIAIAVAVLAPAAASASLVGDVVEKATSTVMEVTAPVSQQSPPAPSTPTSTSVPAAPEVQVKLPAETKSAPSTPSPATGPSDPVAAPVRISDGHSGDSGGGVAGATREVGSRAGAVSTVDGAPSEGTERVPSSGSDGVVAARQDDGAGGSPEAGTLGSGAPVAASPRLVEATGAPPIALKRDALLRRLIARIWPAIALASDGALPVTSEVMRPLLPADVSRLLSMDVPPIQGVLASSAELRRPASGPASVADGISLRTGLEISLFVVCAFGVLLALLGSSLWVELRAARYRW
jgi:hypothetical protein